MVPHKRKPMHNEHSPHPPKKARLENGTSSHEGHSQGVPRKRPELPFIKEEYEKSVFTHASIAVQHPEDPKMVNYETLEFLGDAQIEHIASLVIFERYSKFTPGKMSTVRELLVKNDTLSQFSRLYGFPQKLRISSGANNPQHLPKIQADIFEAYVAAVILSDPDPSNGFATARKWLTELWEPLLATLGMAVLQPKDIKSKEQLAKTVLAKGIKLNYVEEREPVLIQEKGQSTYFMGVYLTGWGYDNQHLGSGTGESKNAGGQNAAATALQNPLLEDITAKRTAYLEEKKKEEEIAAQVVGLINED